MLYLAHSSLVQEEQCRAVNLRQILGQVPGSNQWLLHAAAHSPPLLVVPDYGFFDKPVAKKMFQNMSRKSHMEQNVHTLLRALRACWRTFHVLLFSRKGTYPLLDRQLFFDIYISTTREF